MTDLEPKLNDTLNPVIEQVNTALAEVDTVNNTIHSTNVSSYVAQVDDSKVCGSSDVVCVSCRPLGCDTLVWRRRNDNAAAVCVLLLPACSC